MHTGVYNQRQQRMEGSRTVVQESGPPGSPEYWGEGVKEDHFTSTEVCREMPYSGSGHWHWLIGTVWGKVHNPSASSMRITPEYTLVLQACVSLFPVEAGVEDGAENQDRKALWGSVSCQPPTFQPLGSQVSWLPRRLVMSPFPSQVMRRD